MNKEKLKNYTVLYVEDDLDTRRVYSDYFKTLFKSVYLASNGLEALELYQKFSPDILFLDIDMPKLDGLTLLEKLRKQGSQVPVVILSGVLDKDQLIRAIPLEISAYVKKPFSRVEFNNALEKVLNKLELPTNQIKRTILSNNILYDYQTKSLHYKDSMIALTKNEAILMQILILNKDRYLSISEIVDYFHADYNLYKITEDSARSTLKRIRQKTPKEIIENRHGLGYKILN